MQAKRSELSALRADQQNRAAQRAERLKLLWAGINVGDVVILGPEVTKRAYGLSLCDDDGEAVLLDGEVVQIDGEQALINMRRVYGKPAPGRGPMLVNCNG